MNPVASPQPPAPNPQPSPLVALDPALSGLAGMLWYIWPSLGPWPLLLIAAGRVVRTLTSAQTAWRRTPFDAPLLLFFLSAVIGAGLAYNPTAGWAKFWVIVGGLALYDSLACAPEQVRLGRWQIAPVRVLLVWLPTVIAVYFLLTNDWAARMGKLPWLDPLGRWFATWQPDLPGHRLHPNVAGGLVAALLPLQAAAIGRAKVGWLLIGLALLGLLMSASRGAWMALAAVTLLWAVWQVWGKRWPRGVWRATLAGLIAASALGMALALWIGPVLFPGSRLEVLRTGLDLALDYPFTGLGLAGFQMAYSSYVLLIHVGHTIHSHNLFLNLWIEQGVLGLAAWGWALTLALSARLGAERWGLGVGAALALAVIVIHGLVDDAFYGSRGVLLLFVPFAVLAQAGAVGRPPSSFRALEGAQLPPAPVVIGGRRARWGAAILILALALLPGTRALAQANLGALLQTRAELSVYEWPKWPIQDALRRPAQGSLPPVDLKPAMARYQAALTLDPVNVIANRRLGQIELSLGHYDASRGHLEAAYAVAPGQRATRQLLGEALALAGDSARAVALWRSVDPGQGQLLLRAWWYGAVGEPDNQQRITQAIQQLTTDH